MNRFYKILGAILLVAALGKSAQADEVGLPQHWVQEPTAAIYNFHTDDWNLPGLGIIALTAGASTLAYRTIDDNWHVGRKKELMGNGSTLLSATAYGLAATPAVFGLWGLMYERGSAERLEVWETARELFESLGYSTVATYGLKYAVRRERPNGSDNQSFPSLHASVSFAAATTLAYKYPWYVGAPALALASTVGLTRIDLQQHFVSDVLAGAGIGALFATAVEFYHRGLKGDQKPTSMWVPWIDGQSVGVITQWRF